MKLPQDRIFIEALECHCVIGIFDWERKVRQKILIDLDFPADIRRPTDRRRAARRDRIEDTINYKALAKFLLREIPKTRFQLVETLAEFIAVSCLKEFRLREIKVRISKPGAIRHSRNVGVEIIRKKS